MAGLVPAIYVLAAARQDVDARDKPGHDEGLAPSFRGDATASNPE